MERINATQQAKAETMELNQLAHHWGGFGTVRIIGWMNGHVLFETAGGGISGGEPEDFWIDDTCTKRLDIPEGRPMAMIPRYLAQLTG